MNETFDKLRRLIKFNLRDTPIIDSELDSIIYMVIREIARETKLFKKLCGFTVHADKQVYDFRDITRLNEEVETELSEVYVGSIPEISIKAMLLGRDEWPKPLTIKQTYEETDAMSQYLSADKVLDSDMNNVFDKFRYTATNLYIVEDEQWLQYRDNESMILIYTVIPDINEMSEEDLLLIESVIVEGCKYYVANTMQSGEDSQIANLFYQRYWQRKKDLVNMYPNYIVMKEKDKKWL